jgi:mRNA interferase RelE/StbE
MTKPSPEIRQRRSTAGDVEDAYLVRRYKAARGRVDTEVPWDVAKRIVAGENAVRVYREWRGLTQEALARKVHSAKAFISQIETGAKPGGRAVLGRIAGALGVPVAVLM